MKCLAIRSCHYKVAAMIEKGSSDLFSVIAASASQSTWLRFGDFARQACEVQGVLSHRVTPIQL